MHKSERDRRRIEGEVCRAVSAAEDGTLEESGRQQLNEVLEKDRHARSFYLDLIALRVLLQSIAGRSVRKEAEDRAIELAYQLPGDPPGATGVATRQRDDRRTLARAGAALAIAATLLLAFAGFALREADEPQVAHAEDSTSDQPAVAARNVATVSRVSEGAVWYDPNESLSIETSLREGQTIRISGGEVELVYTSGVQLRLIGPVEYRMKPEGGVLAGGGLLASVPEAGYGFTVETPNGKVVDLGTEFGVVVDDFGFSEVGVFKGKVEAYPLTGEASAQGDSPPLELNEGDGLLWTKSTLMKIDTDARRFEGARRFPVNRLVGSRAEVRSKASSLPSQDKHADWRTLGTAEPTEAGFALRGDASDARPFVVTRGEFDPSEGPITVECDVVFQAAAKSADAVAILTRSDQRRGGAEPPWNDMLATCVRCSLGTNAQTGVGILDAATKHESGWEPVELSWQGFRKPTPGERYHLTMTDDGVNVSFTVALASNPAVHKTVRCRSLFRAVSNHVAIEGPRDGSIEVENLRVYHEPSLAQGDAWLASSAEATDGPSADGGTVAATLQDLVPADAKLLLRDSFDGEQLDTNHWRSLGDVTLRGGKLQLGGSIQDAAIDTWHERPYLLTQEPYPTDAGAITVIGSFEFAKNYLKGYGGSFAVMTRSADEYRDGDGWERSLLASGVRSNFWPSGIEIGRSLELHEVTPDGTVALREHTVYEIDPLSRRYHFRVRDDGKQVELTVVDAANAERRGSVTYATGSSASVALRTDAGRVAFESTWGSPVTLDEIQIYRSPENVE